MFRYLKAAFWARPELVGFGRIPWNALAVAGVAILGFGEPAFWAAGAGAEALYLYMLATNGRFQKWVDATSRALAEERIPAPQPLDAESRGRIEALERKRRQVEQLYRDSAEEDFLFDSNRDALRRLSEMFQKLLVARRNLLDHRAAGDEAELRGRIAAAERELAGGAVSEPLRESREATLAILRQRLLNLHRRSNALTEIESDLTRIEAQFDLALDDAALKGRPTAISANIDLVSHLLDPALLDAPSETVTPVRELER